MTSKQDTLTERIARAQREMASWDSRFLASMQLQGPVEIKADPRQKESPQRGEPYTANDTSAKVGGAR